MWTFKAGDKVELEDGNVVTLLDNSDNGYWPLKAGDFNRYWKADGTPYKRGTRIVRVAPSFSVGDRVRATRSSGGRSFIAGNFYTVTDVSGDLLHAVNEKGIPDAWGAKYFECAPLRIEAGKFYRTRDGRKVGPMAADAPGYLQAAAGIGKGRSFAIRNGKHLFDRSLDLIAEWVDEPAMSVNDPWRISSADGSINIDARAITFTNTTPAIVARIDNGQPKPATRPYVHPNRASAEKEAARLAKANPGREFGVYEFVSSTKEERVYDHEWQRLAAEGRLSAAADALVKLAGVNRKQAMRAAVAVQAA